MIEFDDDLGLDEQLDQALFEKDWFEDQAAFELEYLPVWRAISAFGGICPNPDYPWQDIPRGLLRIHTGHPADIVAVHACNDAHLPTPWGEDGDDVAMMRWLDRQQRAYKSHLEKGGSALMFKWLRKNRRLRPARAANT